MLAHALPKQKRRSWRPGAGDWEGGRSREATVLPQRHGDRAGPCTSSRISAAGRSGRRAPRARLPACLRGEGICVVNYVARRRRFLARLCGKRRGGRMCRVRMLLEHVSCRRALMADGSCGQVTVLALPRHVTYVLASRHLTAQSGEGIWSGMSVRVAPVSAWRARESRINESVSFFEMGSTPTPLTVRAKRVATARPRRSCLLRTASRRPKPANRRKPHRRRRARSLVLRLLARQTRLPGATNNTRYGEGCASPRRFFTHHTRTTLPTSPPPPRSMHDSMNT